METFNKFGVALGSDGLVILLPPPRGGPLSNDDALNLAAWLVALADRDGKFGALLKEIQNS